MFLRRMMDYELKSHGCRICLCEPDNLCSIFKSDINKKIEQYSGVVISESDSFSHDICSGCVEELLAIDKFIEKCRQSDERLRECTSVKNEIKGEINVVFDDVKVESNDDMPGDEIENDQEEDYETTRPLKKPRYKKVRKKLNAYVCSVCGLKATCKSALESHWRTHTGEKPFECHDCGKTYSLKGSLSDHILHKHDTRFFDVRNYFCEVCGKTFKNSYCLSVHMRIHNNVKPYKCEECGKTFVQAGSLNRHLQRHRGERPHSCHICGKSFTDRSHLKRHGSVHSDLRPFVCTVCDKGMKSAFALKQHMILHSNYKEYFVCDKCGMSFTMKGSLVTHLRSVHSEQSGHCLVCNKMYSNLKEHMPVHTGDKKYCCDVCDKQFLKKRGLVIHQKQHTEKFQCSFPQCGKTFQAKWVLECHNLKHTGDTPFICKICDKGFIRMCHLTKHRKFNHSNDE